MWRVLVLNHANWEGLSRLPYLLHQAGCEVDVMCPRANFVAHSAWISRHIEVPSEIDGMLAAVRHRLHKHAARYDWVIVGDDPLLYALSQRRHQAWARRALPCSPDDACIDFMASKLVFAARTHAHGLPVPAFRPCNNLGELRQAASELGYPLVVKQSEGWGGLAVRVLENASELESVPIGKAVIAQAYVRGQVLSAVALYNRGTLTGYYSYLRKRTWGPRGISTIVQFTPHRELESILDGLGRLSRYHGLCGIDLIVEEGSGRLVLLEQNFRPTLTILLGAQVGVDLARLLHGLLSNTPVQQAHTQRPDARHAVSLFPGEMLRAIDQIDFIGLLRFLLHPRSWASLSWHDLPLLRYNLRYLAQFTSDKLRRRVQKSRSFQQTAF